MKEQQKRERNFELLKLLKLRVKRISSANPEFETHDNIIKDQLKTKSKELQNQTKVFFLPKK